MAEDNYNLINPVEALHNIAQLNPVSDRKQRKRKDKWDQKHEPRQEQAQDETTEQQDFNNTDQGKSDGHSIDFRA
jgi:hypothetical protein